MGRADLIYIDPPFNSNRKPIQVKNKDKVGRPDIDSFAHALRRDGRRVGFFIGWEFTRDAHKEIERMAKFDEAMVVIDVPVQQLIAETFDSELLALMDGRRARRR